jgi:hypothetical protein
MLHTYPGVYTSNLVTVAITETIAPHQTILICRTSYLPEGIYTAASTAKRSDGTASSKGPGLAVWLLSLPK